MTDAHALPPIPDFLRRQPKGLTMAEPTNEAPTKKPPTKRDDAIVASIVVYLPVDKDAEDLLDKWSLVKDLVRDAEECLKTTTLEGFVIKVARPTLAKIKTGPDAIVVTADKPKPGRVQG